MTPRPARATRAGAKLLGSRGFQATVRNLHARATRTGPSPVVRVVQPPSEAGRAGKRRKLNMVRVVRLVRALVDMQRVLLGDDGRLMRKAPRSTPGRPRL